MDGLYLPVAAAWQRVLDDGGSAAASLYAADGLHPAPLGTWLAALVLYERMIGKDARLLGTHAVVNGAQLVGDVVQYQDIYRLCYIRGPEGLLIGLAEELKA